MFSKREKILAGVLALFVMAGMADTAVGAYFQERFLKVRHFMSVGLATYPAQFTVQSEDTTIVTGIFRAVASQSVDILQIQNSAGTELFDIDQSGNVTVSGTFAPAGAMTLGGKLTVNDIALIDNDAVSDANVVLTVQGGSAQSGNLLTLEDDGGTDMFTVSIAGNTTAAGTLTSTGAFTATTTSALTGQVICSAGLTLTSVAADPCLGAGYDVGSTFFNSVNDYPCFCDGSTDDIKMSDSTTDACFP